MKADPITVDRALHQGHHDISTREFINRYSALGFERRVIDDRAVFVANGGRLVVAPVMTHLMSVDRYMTIKRLEEMLTIHERQRRGGIVLAIVLCIVAVIGALLFGPEVRAESRRDVLSAAEETEALLSEPSARCDTAYMLMPGETATVTCFHNLVGFTPIERLRSGHDRVLVSVSRHTTKPPGIVMVLHNTGSTKVYGTVIAEFF